MPVSVDFSLGKAEKTSYTLTSIEVSIMQITIAQQAAIYIGADGPMK